MEPLEITFKIEPPHTDYQSDLNTLILRIDKLRHFYNNIFNDKPLLNFEIDELNENIKCVEEILQHMKFKVMKFKV